jgi:mannose-1-phosphate guanylyltransferase
MLIPAIICGGAGSRLWPVSRELHPKPFIRLADGRSLLQKTFSRGAKLPGVSHVLTVTNRELFFQACDEYREVGEARVATPFVLEPFGRGTAAAVASAALEAHALGGDDAILLVLPADHLVSDEASFAAAVDAAVALARGGRLVTFGIRPTAPETGYGYIEADGSDVVRFVEKPTLETALEYVASGRFLWNSGMFCFTAGAIIEQMRAHCPDIIDGVQACFGAAKAAATADRIELPPERFALVRDTSIDYAVMEKSRRVSVVPCDIGWSDIGSWTAIGALVPADDRSNRVEGSVVLEDVSNCYIRASDRVVGAIGVQDLLVIDTADALLLAHRDRAQDVRKVYAELKSRGHDAYKLHRTVHRPWGSYTVIEERPGFKIKRIEVKPGAALSLQMHRHRSEHWVVVTGTASVVNGERTMTIAANESTFIPAGHRHRLSNDTAAPLVIIEVQTGEYVGEDDIVRLDDQYGRVTPAPQPAR